MKTPDIYHIQHPLADRDLPQETLSTFTDADIAEYTSEYEEYRRVQNEAVRASKEIYDTCRNSMIALFGDSDGKQVRYLDRNMRNGQSFVDQHARRYLNPGYIKSSVEEAREKYCAFTSTANAPKTGGEDTLQEINNAVVFLMERHLKLGVDFTVSNAVSVARTVASEEFEDQASVTDGVDCGVHNMMLASERLFPFDKFSVTLNRSGELVFQCEDIKFEWDGVNDDDAHTIRGNPSFSVCFKESSTPQIVIC